MPIRGTRPIWPKPGGTPTGMFRQGQKKDSTASFDNQGTMNYAHGTSSRSKPAAEGGKGLRHQKPRRK